MLATGKGRRARIERAAAYIEALQKLHLPWQDERLSLRRDAGGAVHIEALLSFPADARRSRWTVQLEGRRVAVFRAYYRGAPSHQLEQSQVDAFLRALEAFTRQTLEVATKSSRVWRDMEWHQARTLLGWESAGWWTYSYQTHITWPDFGLPAGFPPHYRGHTYTVLLKVGAWRHGVRIDARQRKSLGLRWVDAQGVQIPADQVVAWRREDV